MWGGAAHVGQGAHVWVQDPQVGECREGLGWPIVTHNILPVGVRGICREM